MTTLVDVGHRMIMLSGVVALMIATSIVAGQMTTESYWTCLDMSEKGNNGARNFGRARNFGTVLQQPMIAQGSIVA